MEKWRARREREGGTDGKRKRESKFTGNGFPLKPNGSKESNLNSQSLLKVPFPDEPFQQTLIWPLWEVYVIGKI